MGDDEDFGEIVFDHIDGFDETLAAHGILAAETFVNDEGLQAGARALGKDFREGQADGEVDPKRFPAAVHFIIARTCPVADDDVESFAEGVGGSEFALGLEADRHFAVGQAVEEFIGFGFDLGEGLFDEQSGYTVFAEGAFKLFVTGDFLGKGFAFSFQGFAAGAEVIEDGDFLFGHADFGTEDVFLFEEVEEVALGLGQVGGGGFGLGEGGEGSVVFGLLLIKFRLQI